MLARMQPSQWPAPTASSSTVPVVRYTENLRVRGRQWFWLAVIALVSALAGALVLVPFVIVAWMYAVVRFGFTKIKIDDHYLWVGAKSAPLAGLDLATLARASNAWPWAVFSDHWLGANPIWTRDSVGLKGRDSMGKKVTVAIGTNRRDDLIEALTSSVRAAQAGYAGTWGNVVSVPAAWYDDPWNPVNQLRWFDGNAWTGYTHVRSKGSR